MKVTTLAPWFGGSRFLAPEVGRLLAGCSWVGIPFAGGMPEVAHIHASTIVVSDLHRHVINLARCLRDPRYGPVLYRRLRRVVFHPDVLAESQEWCKTWSSIRPGVYPPGTDRLDTDAAYHYFIAVWMGRSGKAGGVDEFNGGLSVRWNCNGGDSVVRYRSAVQSIQSWRRILARVNLVVQDCFEFLGNVQDAPRHGLYCDPPFPDSGVKYRHSFTDNQHRHLARVLAAFEHVKVVCRFYDHPLIAELYPGTRWQWHHFTGKKQSNTKAPEVLLTNNRTKASLFNE
jgi:DNA adenine methylase